MATILVAVVIFFAIFTQSVAGFGLALVSMPLLVELIGIRVATPVVALVAITTEVVLVTRYWRSLTIQAVWRLTAASVFAIPIGVWFLSRVDENIVMTVLGVVVMAYALYALFKFPLPALRHTNWAFGFGFVAGLLSGAYNTSGPPMVIYGDCRHWEPAEFKGNLQGFFMVNSFIVITTHALSGNFTATVWQNYLVALPGLALGLAFGLMLDPFIKPQVFRKIVLVLLVMLGLRLIFR